MSLEEREIKALAENIARAVSLKDDLFKPEVILVGGNGAAHSQFEFWVPINYSVRLNLLGNQWSAKPAGSYRSLVPTVQALGSDHVLPVFCQHDTLMVDVNTMLNEQVSQGIKGQIHSDPEPSDSATESVLKMRSLDPKTLLMRFWNCVKSVVDEGVTIRDFNDCHLETQLTFKLAGGSFTADLVPIIQNPFQEWPCEWPRKEVTWLDDGPALIKKIQETGVDLVPSRHWRLHFRRAELILMEAIEAADANHKGYRCAALRCLEYVNRSTWEGSVGHVLSPYHLKVLLFWTCENNPDPLKWQKMRRSVEMLLPALHNNLKTEVLPQYFYPSVNLLQQQANDVEEKVKLGAIAEKVQRMIDDPVHCLSLLEGQLMIEAERDPHRRDQPE